MNLTTPGLLIVFAISAWAQAPRYDAWEIVGPGGGGTTLDVTVSPHDPRLAVERSDMTAGYITHDSGNSWRMFNLLTGIDSFAFDPSNRNVIYAGNVALWRSENNGRTWSMIFPDPHKGTVIHQVDDHADVFFTSQDSTYPTAASGVFGISAIAIDPHDSRRIYVAYAKEAPGNASGSLFDLPPSLAHNASALYMSADYGVSWKRVTTLPWPARLLVVDRANLIVVAGKAAYNVSPGGELTQLGTLSSDITGAAAGRTAGGVWLYATTREGKLALSRDGGHAWRDLTPSFGQGREIFETVAASRQHPEVAYASFRHPGPGSGDKDLFSGIARTQDGGKTWTVVFKEDTRPAKNLEETWIEQRMTRNGIAIYFEAARSLGVAPANPDVCYATDSFRTYRTLDGGRTWKEVNSRRAGRDRWTTRGLDVTTNYGVQFDPFDSRHIFIDYTDIGLFQSSDGGASWQSSSSGVPEAWRNTAYWVAFDPAVKGLMWGAFSGEHDLPRPARWRTRNPLSFEGGVGVSTDGGRHWRPSSQGMPSTPVTDILVDPKSPVGKRTIYATGFGHGVYKSVDNGKTWSLRRNGISEAQPFAWRLTQGGDGTLYLVVARRAEEKNSPVPGPGALYRSADQAEHWIRMNLPAGVDGPTGLAVDPQNARRLYLTAWGHEGVAADHGGGVYLSNDGGQTWTPIFQKSQHVYDLTLDPKSPRVLYITGFDSAAYRSADGGVHWSRIKGYNFKWGHRVIPDPNDPSKIYIDTFGSSVWHGPAIGDPDAQEDIATPVPDSP